jgi:hypothetical protein
MANTTTTIILTGVVLLSQINDNTGKPIKLRASAMKSDLDRVSTRGGAIPRHVAFIRIKKEAIESSNRPVTLTYNDGADQNVYFLNRESIAVAGMENTDLEIPTAVALADFKPLSAVPKLEDFCPTCKPLSQTDFDAPDTRHVAGRIDFTAGKVLAGALSPCNAWNFDAEFGYPAHVQRVMPRQIHVALTVAENNKITITTKALPGVDPAKVTPTTITLKSNENAEVMIGSASIEDAAGVGLGHGLDRVDHHFELFYYLLERSNTAKHPLPIADPSCAAFHRASGIDCPPVLQ